MIRVIRKHNSIDKLWYCVLYKACMKTGNNILYTAITNVKS